MSNQPSAQRTVVVTGAGSGIGKAVADLLRAQGHAVAGVDIRGTEHIADLADQAAREAVARALLAAHPRIDALIACAGISLPEDGARTVSVNYFGATRLAALLRGRLAEAPEPRVVVTASIVNIFPAGQAGVDACLADDEEAARAAGHAAGQAAYTDSKHALSHWVRRESVKPEWAGSGILLNAIAPGTIRTAMAADLFATEEGRAFLAASVPIAVGDYARPEEIAPLYAFLASAENRFMVGQIPFADGGTECLTRGATHPL